MDYIYYGQYTGNSITSKIIKLFTWSQRSHTAAFRPPVNGKFSTVIEAWKKGVTESHWTENHEPGTIIDVYRVPCAPTQAAGFYREMESKLGSKYDFLGVMGFGLRWNIESAQRWFCSESVFDSALKAGIVLLNRVPPHKVYPSLLDLPPHAEFVKQLIVPKMARAKANERLGFAPRGG